MAQKGVMFPASVINYLVDDIAQACERTIKGKKSINFYFGSQINGEAHLGTLVSAFCAHAVAKHFSEYFNLPVKIMFTGLENEGSVVKTVNGIKYQRMFVDDDFSGQEKHQHFITSFKNMFEDISRYSDIETTMSTYSEFQAQESVREGLLKMLENEEVLTKILTPKRDKLGIRFKCPDCGFLDKHYKTLELIEFQPGISATYRSRCFDHGYHVHTITPSNEEFVDTSGMIRNVLKEYSVSAESNKTSASPIIVKGSDWIPSALMVSDALEEMGLSYKERPQRLYTPLILDWSGAKISKSLASDTDCVPESLLYFSKFKQHFGETGIKRLWSEIDGWTKDTRKFYRNYTIDFFKMILDI